MYIIIIFSKLYAVDRCKNRFSTMQTMLKKYGVKNVEPFNMDALSFPYYDGVKYILVDPSCSGSGKHFYDDIFIFLCFNKFLSKIYIY